MLRNYLVTALRNFWKQKGYTFLNLAGLTLGLATSLLILLWVRDELRFDRFHTNSDQLYRIMENQTYSGQLFTFAATPGLLAQALKDELPEVTHATRTTWGGDTKLFRVGDQRFKEEGMYADPDFLEMFTFPFVVGNPKSVLNDVSSIALSEALAAKYFGSAQAALGKTLQLDNKEVYTVQGVFADVPKTSSFQFDFLLSFEVYMKENTWLEEWGNNGIRTFIQLADGASPEAVNEKIADFVKQRNEGSVVTLFAQSFPESYLHGEFKEGQQTGGRIVFVQLFVVVALFILLIACINFMNLATARSTRRAKEVGVRKAIGAERGLLVGQFLGESILLAFLSTLLALLVVEIMLPSFNELTDKALAVPYDNFVFLLILAGIVLFTGLLAGLYPAFYLSSFNPVSVLKGTFRVGSGAAFLRQGLVVFQFVLSMVLIAATVVVYQQIQYIKKKDLGINRENLIYFPVTPGVQEHFDAYKADLRQMPGIQQVALSNQNPLSVGSSTQGLEWEGKDPETKILFQVVQISYDFLPTAGIQLKAGRDFSQAFSTDTSNILINEEAARLLGFDDPVGQPITFWDRKGQIIGVVKNFHSNNLHAAIEPLVLTLRPENTWMVMVRTQPGETPAALASLEALHNRYDADYLFEYNFLDQEFERMYRSDTLVSKLASYFAFIAIFISCLGLFGLASYTAERRRKEIGVRKVLGASVPHLLVLLSNSFTKIVLIAFVVATPLGWWLTQQFLDQYEYHMPLSPLVFVLTGILALLIAWLTVGYQSVRAATSNPVNSLRSE
ncbi:duplicated orphan permease [Catalinimonas alkaloidigena]|uniref:Duplicated orphan permease n=1 Tax=Catalinimonas alkaloidigena TaxID=1075417 RepID=A0A1G8YGA8_9BACT|nr:ABC transporter permease [Catalinimonas alkaloidigena]SDK01090.1 duplicated orphan permease [Catalinimonas alkaloidigena]